MFLLVVQSHMCLIYFLQFSHLRLQFLLGQADGLLRRADGGTYYLPVVKSAGSQPSLFFFFQPLQLKQLHNYQQLDVHRKTLSLLNALRIINNCHVFLFLNAILFFGFIQSYLSVADLLQSLSVISCSHTLSPASVVQHWTGFLIVTIAPTQRGTL